MKQLSLSWECLSYIDSLDLEYSRDYPAREDQETTDLFRAATKLIIESREGFTGKGFEAIEELVKRSPDFVADQLDDFLTRLLLGEVRGMVERVINLSRLEAPSRPSNTTSVYIQEAARTYVYGFYQASVAMSRAALEQAMKERLAHQGTGIFIKFQDLVDEAKKWRILDDKTARAVRDTAMKADSVLHVEPTDKNGALDVLIEARGLLQQIYAAGGGF